MIDDKLNELMHVEDQIRNGLKELQPYGKIIMILMNSNMLERLIKEYENLDSSSFAVPVESFRKNPSFYGIDIITVSPEDMSDYNVVFIQSSHGHITSMLKKLKKVIWDV